jgi:hypothetical protein
MQQSKYYFNYLNLQTEICTWLDSVNLLHKGSLTMLVFLHYITIIDTMLFDKWGNIYV